MVIRMTIRAIIVLVMLMAIFKCSRGIEIPRPHQPAIEEVKPFIANKDDDIFINHPLSYKELRCLSKNIYHEARGEGIVGMAIIAKVTLNRVGRWASDTCKVVYQKAQFSWTLDERLRYASGSEMYEPLTSAIVNQGVPIPAKFAEATHYYNPDMVKQTPSWAYKLIPLGRYGSHLFFKDPNS